MKGKIEKVPRGIQCEKSRIDTASSVKLVSTIRKSPKGGGGRNQVSGNIYLV